MVPNSVQSRDDARSASRSSIYLAAALYCDGLSSPVKIRNISPAGALVEAAAVPAEGALVQLVRGALIVHALVAWTGPHRFGLKFSGRVDVQQWRSAPGNGEQQRVDDLVRLVKAGAVPLPVPPHRHGSVGQMPLSERGLFNDLKRALGLLDQLGDALAVDADLVARHGGDLQKLDIAMQVIAAVEAVLSGESNRDIDATKFDGLRRSADEALKRNA